MSPVDVSNKNFLSQDIKYHLEMGDSFYLLGGTLLDKKYDISLSIHFGHHYFILAISLQYHSI